MVEEEIVARVEAAAIVGASIYPHEAPQDAPARYIVFRRDDTSPADTLGAHSVHHITFAFEAHAESYAAAATLAGAMKPVLDNWTAEPPAALMSMTYAGEHDGAGAYDEAARRRRTFCREQTYIALVRA